MTFITRILLLVLLVGCGGGLNDTLRKHTIAAVAFDTVNDSAVTVIEGTCERRAVEAAESGDTAAEGEAAALEVLHTCEALQVHQRTVATSYESWTRLLMLMAVKEADFDQEALLHLAVEVVRVYNELERAIRVTWDVDLPDIPDIVLGLLGDNAPEEDE